MRIQDPVELFVRPTPSPPRDAGDEALGTPERPAGRIKSMDYIRAIAILAVVSIHVAWAYSWDSVTTVPIVEFYIFRNLPSFAVPMFICISGVLLAYRYRDRPLDYRKMIRNRVLAVFVPAAVWSLIYMAYTGVLGTQGLLQMTNYIVFGKFMHLYFIPLIIQLYLLFPLFDAVARRIRSPLWLLALLALQPFVTPNVAEWMPFLNQTLGSSFFIHWVFIFVAGCYIGHNFESARQWAEKHWLAIIAGIGLVLAYRVWDFYHMTTGGSSAWLNYSPIGAPSNFIYTLLVMGLIVKVATVIERSARIDRWLLLVARNAFGIYLCHILFIRLWNDAYKVSLHPAIQTGLVFVLASFLLVLFLSISASVALNRLPFGQFLIGKNR